MIIAGMVVITSVWFFTDGFENWCPRGYRSGFFSRGKGCGEIFALVMGVLVFFGGFLFSAQGLSGWLMADKETGPVADME